jgi:arylsulfatase
LVGRSVSPTSGLQRQKWELYHMKEDGTELKDLATTHPDKVEALSTQWEKWAQRVNVFPKPGRKTP